MGRLSKAEEAERNFKIVEMISNGFSHHQIAKEVGMRPQNVLMCKAWKIAHGEWEGDLALDIVSPQDQRNMLEDVTARAIDDLDDLDQLINVLMSDPMNQAGEIRRIKSLKKEYYVEIANMWAIAQTIAGGGGPTKTTGDKTQINIGQIDYQKVQEAGEKATKILDEARLDGLIREDS